MSRTVVEVDVENCLSKCVTTMVPCNECHRGLLASYFFRKVLGGLLDVVMNRIVSPFAQS